MIPLGLEERRPDLGKNLVNGPVDYDLGGGLHEH